MEELVSCNPVACAAGEEISNIFFSEIELKSKEELSEVAVFNRRGFWKYCKFTAVSHSFPQKHSGSQNTYILWSRRRRERNAYTHISIDPLTLLTAPETWFIESLRVNLDRLCFNTATCIKAMQKGWGQQLVRGCCFIYCWDNPENPIEGAKCVCKKLIKHKHSTVVCTTQNHDCGRLSQQQLFSFWLW